MPPDTISGPKNVAYPKYFCGWVLPRTPLGTLTALPGLLAGFGSRFSTGKGGEREGKGTEIKAKIREGRGGKVEGRREGEGRKREKGERKGRRAGLVVL